ncbi:MAG: hypothetical protein FJ399_08235, partial [Verrucomicrobia bacterium]|nr:hypothetical protein [Verrucomicrobiota bacterium]
MPAAPCSPLHLIRVFFTLLAASLMAFAATTSSTRTFDVPAGDAVATLKQFSAQAEVQVLFPPEQVRSIRTPAVRGDLLPAEALERMLAGTILTIVRDEKTGAFGVRRALVTPPKAEAARADAPSATRAANPLVAA